MHAFDVYNSILCVDLISYLVLDAFPVATSSAFNVARVHGFVFPATH